MGYYCRCKLGMFDYLVYGANSKGIAFTEIILKWTKKTVMLIDDDWNPTPEATLQRLQKYESFYHLFGNQLTFDKYGHKTLVNAKYSGTPKDIWSGSEIVLQNVFKEEKLRSAEIIAKIEALEENITLYPLVNNWTQNVTHYINYFNLYNCNSSDLLLQ